MVAVATAAREAVAEAAVALSHLGLVTGFGHVSARIGASMLITPASDLGIATEATIIEVPLDASALPPGAPAEAWAHLALYRKRPDASAVARAQPPSAFAVAAAADVLRPMHGQAAWLGASVPVHHDARPLRTLELALRAAERLPTGEALLLRGNGGLTLGETPGIAVTRMWLLAAACDVWLATRGAVAVTELRPEEILAWRAVQDELLTRLWRHLLGRSLGSAVPPGATSDDTWEDGPA